jgi:hypothetical protein
MKIFYQNVNGAMLIPMAKSSFNAVPATMKRMPRLKFLPAEPLLKDAMSVIPSSVKK